MIKKNGGIFGRNPTYNDVTIEGVLTLKEAQTIDNDLTINGDLVVNGTTTTINAVNLDVDDKNISMGVVVAKVGLVSTTNITAGQFTVSLASTVGLLAGMTATKTAGTGAFGVGAKIASVDSATQITMDVAHATSGSITFDTGGATDDTANGGGITLKGTTDKLITWIKAKAAWVFSEKIEAPDAVITGLTASQSVFSDSNKKLVSKSNQDAINTLAGAVTSGQYLRGDGTDVKMSAIQAADVPTLNQSTTGSAGAVKSNSTTGLLQVTGPAAGATRVMTTPDANFTAARTDAAQTFTGAQTFGNIKVDTNTISSTNTNGDINISPNGTGAAVFGRYVTIGDGTLYSLSLNGAVSTNPTINWKIGGGMRFALLHAGTESGGNAGGDLTMYRYTDAGGYLGGVLEITRSNGNVKVMDGNLVIGTSGKGIDFSATPGTGTSELFADYEEGTFTPTLTGSSTAITLTYTSQIGSYTKIGDTVIVRGYVKVNTVTGAGSGFLVLNTGLWNSNANPVAGSAVVGKIAHSDYVSAQMRGTGSSSLVFLVASAAGAPATVNATDVVSGSEIYFTVSYKAA